MISSLEGRRILITRQAEQAASMCAFIHQLGGIPICVPVICFKSVALSCSEQSALRAQIRQAGWIIFTSRNSIDFLIEYRYMSDLLKKKKIATVGIQTAHRLEEIGLHADIVSRTFNVEMLVRTFREREIHEETIVIPHGSLANMSRFNELRLIGMQVYESTIYETIPDWQEKERLAEVVKSGSLDALTFASPSAVRFFTEMLDEHLWRQVLGSSTVVSIGDITAQTLTNLGYPPDVIPDRYTAMDMIRALERYY
ncbi:uroporphyrinogen-III synthase [Sporolactobacillus shoreicorticis]|uniref:Uroporphyrinogen-III synthase n=1 Tax=Sporolactobacillus shoreicorticis TaxID=1923877 RepID=A0ABW5RYI4_9BACL|nr:uroporphyrinogen-III synthase [Sporolactobacillus shoreicorticis]MCO7125187.1 uroporphyrinogen-III synthase [Sporolactobacillus shoreicorticis]